MRALTSLFLTLMPSFVHVAIRRLMGQKIGKGSKIRFGSFIFTDQFSMGSESTIGPFSFIKTEEITIGDHCGIKSFSIIKTRKVELGKYVQIAPLCVINSEFLPTSTLFVGDHSRLFPFCWLDTGEGIHLGKHVGVGGHTLMFTHGVWANYVDGGPVSFGPIKLEDNVWLPWRVFVLPNVTIGENCIVGANSLINKSFEKNSLVAGSPAKVLKQMEFDSDEKVERMQYILEKFSEYLNYKTKGNSKMVKTGFVNGNQRIQIDNSSDLKKNDLFIRINSEKNVHSKQQYVVFDYPSLTFFLNGCKNDTISYFISFLRRYGVRVYIEK